jgi:hypothetical protein
MGQAQWYKSGLAVNQSQITALENGEVDVIIALTEGLVAEIVKGKNLQLFGTYVESPLRWAVSTGKETPYNSVADLKNQVRCLS